MRIVYIDDDPDEVLIFCESLKEIDPAIECVGLTDSKCGLDLLERNSPPDLIFLDYNMPGMTGEDCLLRIRMLKHLRNVPVVIYSTGVSETHKQRLLLKGASIVERKHTSMFGLRSFFYENFRIKPTS
jgi:CheY-like chemotaxis protein